MIMCGLKAAQMYGLPFRAPRELVKPLASFLPNDKNILFLVELSSLAVGLVWVFAAPPRPFFSCKDLYKLRFSK